MPDRESALELLAPVLDIVRTIDPADPEAGARLSAALPLDGPLLLAVAALVRSGLSEGWMVPRQGGGVRYGRLAKPTEETHGFSIDAVDMSGPGPGHVHPRGEIDLSFALDGDPRFDGQPEGWLVLPPGSWHIPTVAGGRMGILYFLPGGEIEFGPRPDAG
jgi:hypothetical protein